MAILTQDLENKLWSTADQLRANSELTSATWDRAHPFTRSLQYDFPSKKDW